MITAVVPYARSGIIGAVILGLGRALGETMAVTMLIGNRHEIAASLFAPGYTMAAAIANEFSEAVGDMHLSALAYVAFVLFVVTVLVNAGARLLIWRVARGSGGGSAGACEPPGAPPRHQQPHGRRSWSARSSWPCCRCFFILVTLRRSRAPAASSLDFFTKMPAPAGETGGGVAHAIVGTLLIVGVACLIGLPIGIGGGHLSAPSTRAAGSPGSRRFVADVLNGTPSIVVGVFAWTWIVATQKHFSALAGQRRPGHAHDADGRCAPPRR